MKEIMGYQLNLTGYLGYEYYLDEDCVCHISLSCVPIQIDSKPVCITGYGEKWETSFDPMDTIVPGTFRKVKAVPDGKEFRIEVICFGECQIVFSEMFSEIKAIYSENTMVFIRGDSMVAKIDRLSGIAHDLPKQLEESYYDVYPYYRVMLFCELNPIEEIAIITFPHSRF